jgi:hypothetical protein
MKSDYTLGPYDPCPCGSGAKYKWCCAAKAKDVQRGKFPVGAVALHGPDDKTTTRITAAVVRHEFDDDPPIERFVGDNVAGDSQVTHQIKQFFARHGVKNVEVTEGNIGCPHEEGVDYARGGDCPFCPFWAGKQGAALEQATDEDSFDAEEDEDDQGSDGGFEIVIPDHEDDEDDEQERDWDAAFERVQSVLGDRELDFDEAVDVLLEHLRANLKLPCEVTGIEDFRWEEPYVLGVWSAKEYDRLRRTQPSFEDDYQLLRIDRSHGSKWMLFSEDLCAKVRRVSDGREFVLGLAELKAADKSSPNHQLLDDYSVWFVNSR